MMTNLISISEEYSFENLESFGAVPNRENEKAWRKFGSPVAFKPSRLRERRQTTPISTMTPRCFSPTKKWVQNVPQHYSNAALQGREVKKYEKKSDWSEPVFCGCGIGGTILAAIAFILEAPFTGGAGVCLACTSGLAWNRVRKYRTEHSIEENVESLNLVTDKVTDLTRDMVGTPTEFARRVEELDITSAQIKGSALDFQMMQEQYEEELEKLRDYNQEMCEELKRFDQQIDVFKELFERVGKIQCFEKNRETFVLGVDKFDEKIGGMEGILAKFSFHMEQFTAFSQEIKEMRDRIFSEIDRFQVENRKFSGGLNDLQNMRTRISIDVDLVEKSADRLSETQLEFQATGEELKRLHERFDKIQMDLAFSLRKVSHLTTLLKKEKTSKKILSKLKELSEILSRSKEVKFNENLSRAINTLLKHIEDCFKSSEKENFTCL